MPMYFAVILLGLFKKAGHEHFYESKTISNNVAFLWGKSKIIFFGKSWDYHMKLSYEGKWPLLMSLSLGKRSFFVFNNDTVLIYHAKDCVQKTSSEMRETLIWICF